MLQNLRKFVSMRRAPEQWRQAALQPETPMLAGSCHCGAVQLQISRKPRRLTSCNCSVCRRYGTLWAYYDQSQIRISAPRGATASYSWGNRQLRFVRCATCGCITHWAPVNKAKRRMGVNVPTSTPQSLNQFGFAGLMAPKPGSSLTDQSGVRAGAQVRRKEIL